MSASEKLKALEYTEENVYWTKEGWRRCNECRRISQKRKYWEALT